MKKSIGFVVVILGVVSILFANYIHGQVDAGKQKVSSAEKKVGQANSLFSLNPVVKEIGQEATNRAQDKIDEGKETIGQYERIAQWLQMGGIVLVIVGAGIVLVSFLKKK
jgi:peptidoglycan hydrolase CwlO-like protein